MIRELFKRQGGTGMIRAFVPVPTIENAICEKNKQLLKEVYTTPKQFAECIDTVFSKNVDKIAHYFGCKADRDNISVDMFMEWLNKEGCDYAEFIGFVNSYYKNESRGSYNS